MCFLFSALSCDAKNILYSPCSSAVPRRRGTCCCRHCSSPPLLYYSTNTYVIICRAPGWGGNQISPGQTCRPFVTPRRARVSAFVPHWAPCSTLAFPHVSYNAVLSRARRGRPPRGCLAKSGASWLPVPVPVPARDRQGQCRPLAFQRWLFVRLGPTCWCALIYLFAGAAAPSTTCTVTRQAAAAGRHPVSRQCVVEQL